MIIDVITIFPGMFEGPMSTSVIGTARTKGALTFRTHDLRSYTRDRHRTTDDAPYGGGPGMVMKPEPIFEAVEAVGRLHEGESRTIFFAPAGRPFDQALARELSLEQRLVFVCGRYEGFDERVFTLADDVISIGDYVLTGGELPAMVVADAVTRLIPGVLGDDESSVEESFTDGLLEYPQFTRPALYRGLGVPEVLRSGDHAAIAEYRRREAVIRTATVRPDLLARADLTPAERELLSGDPSATPDGEEGTR